MYMYVSSLRGGKDFFVLVFEQLMFVKGTGKHWCKYPKCNNYCVVDIMSQCNDVK